MYCQGGSEIRGRRYEYCRRNTHGHMGIILTNACRSFFFADYVEVMVNLCWIYVGLYDELMLTL